MGIFARSMALLVVGAAASGLGVVAAADAVTSPGAGDLALLDATLWDGTGSAQRAASLLVADGRVMQIASRDEVVAQASDGARLLDLDGAMVLPGLRDQHLHVLDTGIPGLAGGASAPSFSDYNPVQSEALRAVILGFHTQIFARGETPESGCTRSEVTDEVKDGLVADEDELLRQGLVATVEAGLSDLGLLDALFELADEGRLRTRWLPRIGAGCMQMAADLGYVTGFGNDWVEVLGVKLYSDGWLGPRSASMREAYSDRPLHQGFLFLDPAEAEAEVQMAVDLGFNITTHAIGDQGIEVVLDAYEAKGVTPEDRWQIEHAQVTDLDLIDRFADLGVVASIQTSFATTDQRFAESALGAERLSTSYNWRTMLDRGVPMVGSTDFPVEVLAPLWGVQRMVTRVEFDGFPGEEGFQPDQKLALDRTLQLITRDAAWASLEESDRGTIEVGKFADLTVVRENLFAMPEDCIASATVLMTIVNGQVGFEGAQAYPPGAADCPSGAAPAAAPVITEVSATQGRDHAAPDDPSSLPATGGGLVLMAVAAIALRRGLLR